jgi:hypothetical protein
MTRKKIEELSRACGLELMWQNDFLVSVDYVVP